MLYTNNRTCEAEQITGSNKEDLLAKWPEFLEKNSENRVCLKGLPFEIQTGFYLKLENEMLTQVADMGEWNQN